MWVTKDYSPISMWKTFYDISKQNAFDLYLSAFGCRAGTSQLLNAVFETSLGAFYKSLLMGRAGDAEPELGAMEPANFGGSGAGAGAKFWYCVEP